MDLILDSDVLFKIMLASEFSDALRMSLVNKACYDIFQKNQIFWEEMLDRIINQNDKHLVWVNDNKSTFIKCYKIKKFIKKLNNQSIPSEISQLVNLQKLYLYKNQLSSIPSE